MALIQLSQLFVLLVSLDITKSIKQFQQSYSLNQTSSCMIFQPNGRERNNSTIYLLCYILILMCYLFLFFYFFLCYHLREGKKKNKNGHQCALSSLNHHTYKKKIKNKKVSTITSSRHPLLQYHTHSLCSSQT